MLFLILISIALAKNYYYDCQHTKLVNSLRVYTEALYDTGSFEKAEMARKATIEFGEKISSNIYTCKLSSFNPIPVL